MHLVCHAVVFGQETHAIEPQVCEVLIASLVLWRRHRVEVKIDPLTMVHDWTGEVVNDGRVGPAV